LHAWSFADALRVDGQDWKALRPEEPLIKELRLEGVGKFCVWVTT